MSLDKNDVRRVAFLARIKVDEADLEPVAQDLNNIIGWVEQLAEVDTDGVEPMTGAAGLTMARRDDVVTDGGDPEKVLSNAPDRVGDFYAVPKVVE
ncbi:MAG: Asp-tRNA(Asn)/Glu-tRNA(Gln) amidotransferase GatCAB subunit C [Rhodospirillaceae bacterium]|nr:Asp-tRNA(Asn)/Glu-tRNA(Gln) amidotransferase GatCAB subunit C [Rhodospirillaceae bacterium]